MAIIPAAIAIGEKTNTKPENFWNAVILGLEIVTRIGAWLGRDHHLPDIIRQQRQVLLEQR